jgi:hypothetical protein
LNESAKAQYLATEEARRGVVLSLVSEVATTYFTLRALDEQLVISKSTVAASTVQRRSGYGAMCANSTPASTCSCASSWRRCSPSWISSRGVR